MGKIAMMLAVAIMVALSAIVWTKSTVSATSPVSGSAMSGYDLHLQADADNLRISEIPDAI